MESRVTAISARSAVVAAVLALIATATTLPAAARNFVQDKAAIFSPATIAQLDERIAKLNANTGVTILVLTVPSLDPGMNLPTTAMVAADVQNVKDGVIISIDWADRRDFILPIGDSAEDWFTPDIVLSMQRQLNSAGGIIGVVDAIINIYRAHLGNPPQPSTGSTAHHNVFWWLAAACTVLTLAALYAQFLIGDSDRALRDRLTDWYVFIADNTWSRLFNYSARSTERFLSYLFGGRILSARYVLTASALALVVNLVFIAIALRVESGLYSHASITTKLLDHFIRTKPYLIVVPNVAIDVVVLALSRRYFRDIAERKSPRVLLDVLAILTIGYFAICLTFLPIHVLGFLSYGYAVDYWSAIGQCLEWPIWLPYTLVVDPGSTLAYLYLVPAVFSTALMFAIYIGTVLIFVSRPIIQKPLANAIERLAGVKSGVLPTVLSCLAGLSALLGYLKQ